MMFFFKGQVSVNNRPLIFEKASHLKHLLLQSSPHKDMEIYVAKALLNTPGDSENVKITSRIFSPNQFPGVGYTVLENYKKNVSYGSKAQLG